MQRVSYREELERMFAAWIAESYRLPMADNDWFQLYTAVMQQYRCHWEQA